MCEGYGIWLPITTGRAHDDRLSPVERALTDAMVELGRDRLRVVVGELLSVERFRLELDELLLDLEDGGV
jgi:hypothetical protein